MQPCSQNHFVDVERNIFVASGIASNVLHSGRCSLNWYLLEHATHHGSLLWLDRSRNVMRYYAWYAAANLTLTRVVQLLAWDVSVVPALAYCLRLRWMQAQIPKVTDDEPRVRVLLVDVARLSQRVCFPTLLDRSHHMLVNIEGVRSQ